MESFSQKKLTRRSVLVAAAAGAFVNALPVGPANIAHAAFQKPVPYGVAVELKHFRNDPQFRENLIRHADLIVPMNALKWASLRYDRNGFDFSGADELMEFAERNGKSTHGHALLWYHANPKWLDAITSPRELERLLIEHIETVVGRYAGRIPTWDVVNEVVAHNPLNEGKWRSGVWYNGLGPRHVDLAFEVAARTDPKARLFVNDYDLEDDSLRTEARQKAILQIIQRLQDKNIPVHGVGFQAHLYAERAIGHDALGRFLDELKVLGVEAAVTELDVIDWKLSADPQIRDQAVARTVSDFLSAFEGHAVPRNITTWGMQDTQSWIGDTFPRKDSAQARPLPFDADWNRKPFFDVLQRFTRGES
ncbi:MAG: endo-1,4-beta-xylanase [Pseudomonadota bacterium]